MDGLDEELVSQIREMGFQSEAYVDTRPADSTHYLMYTANWSWDMAMWLTYFSATLYDGETLLGEVEYDARRAGGRLSKFGKTANKIRPLLRELLKDANRGTN